MASSELIETWTLYAVGSLVIFARIGCRWRMIGFSAFQPDDYIIVFSWVSRMGRPPYMVLFSEHDLEDSWTNTDNLLGRLHRHDSSCTYRGWTWRLTCTGSRSSEDHVGGGGATIRIWYSVVLRRCCNLHSFHLDLKAQHALSLPASRPRSMG